MLDRDIHIMLPFDQYSRYASCAEVLDALTAKRDTILDVGSGQACVLHGFLPDHEVTYLDPLLAAKAAAQPDGRYIPRTLDQADLPEGSFDFVVCVDTLEHIPQKQRPNFLGVLSRIARKGIIVSCPCRDKGAALNVDARVNRTYRHRTGNDYPWLAEHFAYGLPSRRWVLGELARLEWHAQSEGNGHGPWLESLLSWYLSLLDTPGRLEQLGEINREFNGKLYPYDYLDPCYRQIIVGMRESGYALPARATDNRAARREAAEAWGAFQEYFIEQITTIMVGDAQAAKKTDGVLTGLNQAVQALERRQEGDLQSQDILQGSSDALIQRVDALSKELAALRGELTSPDGGDVEATIVKMGGDLAGLLDQQREFADSFGVLGGLNQTVQALEHRLEGELRAQDILQESNAALIQRVDALYKELAATREADMSADGEVSVQEIIMKMGGDLTGLLAQQRQFAGALSDMQSQITVNQPVANRLQADSQSLLNSSRELQNRMEAALAEIASLTRVNGDLQMSHRVLQQETEALQGEIGELRKDNALFKASQELQREKFIAATEEVRKLARNNAALHRTNQRTREAMQQRRLQKERLQEKFEAMKEELAATEKKDAELQQINERLRQANEHLRQLAQQHRDELERILTGKSYRVTSPFRFVAHTCRRALRWTKRAITSGLVRAGKLAYRWFPLGDRFRWRLTVLFFWLFRPLLKQTAVWHSYRQEKKWRESTFASLASTSADGLTRGSAQSVDIIVWGVIDWHFRIQRPQHLARELAARGHRVFYISPRFVRRKQPGFTPERIDGDGEIYNIRFHLPGQTWIYHGEPEGAVAEHIRECLAQMLRWADVGRALSRIDHPAWRGMALVTPNSQICYDCMDNHQGFANTCASLITVEDELLDQADLVTATSAQLYNSVHGRKSATALIRNACEFDHFAEPPDDVYVDPDGRRIIGYYGAIADWFDQDLVRSLARQYPDVTILLVGADTADVLSSLSDCPTVRGIGEVSYDELPRYFHAMDVCTIPFELNELTLATNPVKIYEYLSAGKPVVTTDLPELREPTLDQLIYRTTSQEDFCEAIGRALAESVDDDIRQERRDYAAGQTWSARAGVFDVALEGLSEPRVSVVVVTWNNLGLTQACLDSLLADDYANCELIFVDNGSNDGTQRFLQGLARSRENVRVILNEDNRGFAAANNQGMQAATGEYVVLLNNDTQTPPGWLRTLVGHLRRDPTIGIIGPVTNNIGNEARVKTSYTTPEDMLVESRHYTQAHAGKTFEIAVLAFFCVVIPREVLDQIGQLDENYGMGFFEDDDFCQRVRQAGYRVVCAEDAFVHHELSASFKKVDDSDRKALFEKNRTYTESKWGLWEPHTYRTADAT